jgi:hypothetical protein
MLSIPQELLSSVCGAARGLFKPDGSKRSVQLEHIAPEAVTAEQECKCKVVQGYYSDNEELLAKLAAGAKGYDILVPTSSASWTLMQRALLPIDKRATPN